MTKCCALPASLLGLSIDGEQTPRPQPQTLSERDGRQQLGDSCLPRPLCGHQPRGPSRARCLRGHPEHLGTAPEQPWEVRDGLQHPPLAGASRLQPGKPVPRGGYARSVTGLWLLPRPGAGSRLTPRGRDLSSHHRGAPMATAPQLSWEQRRCRGGMEGWARMGSALGFLCESRVPCASCLAGPRGCTWHGMARRGMAQHHHGTAQHGTAHQQEPGVPARHVPL